MLYIIYQIDKPDSTAIRTAHRAAHLRYLDDYQDIVVLGGPRWPKTAPRALAVC
jgi:uncharacterized protein YciI